MKKFYGWLAALLLLAMAGAQAEGTAPKFTTTRLLDAMAGVYYHIRLDAKGDAPLAYSFYSNPQGGNAFPNELEISSEGVISGTPKYAGTYTFSIQVSNKSGVDRTQLTLKVKPFDESTLEAGGKNPDIIGAGQDPIAGVANVLAGGRVLIYADTAYFTDIKGFLYSAAAPFKKAELRFKARAYAWLDANGDTLYYYQRYLDNKATATAKQAVYTMRIASDPLGAKGRGTLTALGREGLANLSVTDKIALWTQAEGMLMRVSLKGGSPVPLRVYYKGQALAADMALPHNGYVYFRALDGLLYRAPLDGQIAQPLTREKITAYTLAGSPGQEALYWTDRKNQLYRAALDGEAATAIEGVRASALNADAQHVYYINPADKGHIWRFACDGQSAPEAVCQTPAKGVYVFDGYIAFEAKKGRALYALSLTQGAQPIRLGK